MPFQHRLVVAGALYLCTFLIWGVYGSAAAGGRNTWRAVGVLGLLVLSCAYRRQARRQGLDDAPVVGHPRPDRLVVPDLGVGLPRGPGTLAPLLAATAACIATYALCHARPRR